MSRKGITVILASGLMMQAVFAAYAEKNYLTIVTGFRAGTEVCEPPDRLPARFSLMFIPLGEDCEPIFFPASRDRGVPVVAGAYYDLKANCLALPVSLTRGDPTPDTGGFTVVATELDPDDPTHLNKARPSPLEAAGLSLGAVKDVGTGGILAYTAWKSPLPSTAGAGQADEVLERAGARLTTLFTSGRSLKDDPVGSSVWCSRSAELAGEDRAVRLVSRNPLENTDRGTVWARRLPVVPRGNLAWIMCTIDSIKVHREAAAGETGKNTNVELFIMSRMAMNIEDLSIPASRWPVGKEFVRVPYDESVTKIETPFRFTPKGTTKWPIPPGKEIGFVYLEAMVLDEDPGKGDDFRRDPADMLGILSATHLVSDLLEHGKEGDDGSVVSQFSVNLKAPAADRLGRLVGLKQVKGGGCTLKYSIGVALR